MPDGIELPDPFTYGYGAKTCAQFTEQYAANRNVTSLLYYCWFQGFLTSFNFNRKGQGKPPLNYEATSLQVLDDQAFLRLYCAEHPHEMFIVAALKLIGVRMRERGL